jgi:type I restriction enzyme M protein
LDVLATESQAKKEVKDLEKELDDKLCLKYPQLTEDEVKDLVVNKKRLARIDADVEMEQDRVSQALTQ